MRFFLFAFLLITVGCNQFKPTENYGSNVGVGRASLWNLTNEHHIIGIGEDLMGPVGEDYLFITQDSIYEINKREYELLRTAVIEYHKVTEALKEYAPSYSDSIILYSDTGSVGYFDNRIYTQL